MTEALSATELYEFTYRLRDGGVRLGKTPKGYEVNPDQEDPYQRKGFVIRSVLHLIGTAYSYQDKGGPVIDVDPYDVMTELKPDPKLSTPCPHAMRIQRSELPLQTEGKFGSERVSAPGGHSFRSFSIPDTLGGDSLSNRPVLLSDGGTPVLTNRQELPICTATIHEAPTGVDGLYRGACVACPFAGFSTAVLPNGRAKKCDLRNWLEEPNPKARLNLGFNTRDLVANSLILETPLENRSSFSENGINVKMVLSAMTSMTPDV